MVVCQHWMFEQRKRVEGSEHVRHGRGPLTRSRVEPGTGERRWQADRGKALLYPSLASVPARVFFAWVAKPNPLVVF